MNPKGELKDALEVNFVALCKSKRSFIYGTNISMRFGDESEARTQPG